MKIIKPLGLKVVFKLQTDEYGFEAVDYLGKFSSKPIGRFYLDRKSGHMIDSKLNLDIESFVTGDTFDTVRFMEVYGSVVAGKKLLKDLVNPEEFYSEDANTRYFNLDAFIDELDNHVDHEEMVKESKRVGFVGSSWTHGTFEYLSGFQHDGDHSGLTCELGTEFTPEETSKFAKFGIKPVVTKEQSHGYWLDVLYCCQDAARLEDYGNGWENCDFICTLTDEDDNEIASACLGGVESDIDQVGYLGFMQGQFDEMLSDAVKALEGQPAILAMLADIKIEVEGMKPGYFDHSGFTIERNPEDMEETV